MVNLFSVVAIDEPETDSMGHDDAMMAEHLDRRAALQVGTGLFGLSLPSYLAAARAGQVLDWVSAGKLNIRVGKRFALSEAAQAHRALESRQTTGKVLLIP